MKKIETTNEKESQQDVGELSLQKTNGNKNELPMQHVDLSGGNLPDLDNAETMPFDLMADYWSPKLAGEEKRVFFDCLKIRQVKDQTNPEVIIELLCAFFFEKVNGEVKTVSNGSKRLVGAIESNNIERGTPLVITYLGKKRNATNGFSSDDWRISPLILKIK